VKTGLRPGRLLRWADRLSPAAVILLSVAVPALLRLLLLPILPIPEPGVEDEFSYLLAADTFAHGRMANSPLPLGVFFESFHVLVRPTYASMYQPGQGAILAIGQVLFGHPWWGVFLSSALMCGAIAWLLLARAPRRWALVGGLSFGLLFGLESYWINSYWGGALPAFGGALAVGAVSRICFPGWKSRGRPLTSGVLLGLGGAILLFTRPWEGACLGAALALAALWWNVRRGTDETRRAILYAAVPAVCILGAAGLLLLRYNQRVTGDPWLPPYLLNLRTYYVAPLFLWQDEKPSPEYPTEIMCRFYTGWRESEGSLRKAQGTRSPIVGLAMWIWEFKLVAGTVAAALVVALLLRGPRTRWLLALLGLVLAALSVQSVRQLHYLAPAAGLFVAVQVTGLRALGTVRVGGHRLLRHLPLVVLSLVAMGASRSVVLARSEEPRDLRPRRAHLVARLNGEPGRHLVLVRYGPKHSVHEEWVYNGADVDGAAVVFAHERSTEENALLLSHFSGRRAWLLSPDDGDRLTPLSRQGPVPPSTR
jgi:hypothetical protein